MSELLKLGKSVLAAQPFSVLIGAELTALEPGRAEIVIPIKQELKQQHGFAHGGIVCYAADNALTFAGGSVLGDSLTLEFKINYTRPAVGAKLIARATVISQGKTQAVCRCDVFAVAEGEEKLCAAAQGTIRKV
jgi:uncharacterized protein (TIGR00369 family)